MARAREQIIHDHCADALRAEVNAWQHAQAVRAYCAALGEAAAAIIDPRGATPDRGTAAWALAHADSIDPLQAPSGTPEDPEITPTMLAERLPTRWRWTSW